MRADDVTTVWMAAVMGRSRSLSLSPWRLYIVNVTGLPIAGIAKENTLHKLTERLAQRRHHDHDCEQERCRRSQGGFTLIELMVVLLIIGILAAIAIPTYLSERSKAQGTAAETTDRNALTAVQAVYAAQDAYVVPSGWSPSGSSSSGSSSSGSSSSGSSCTTTDFACYMQHQEPALTWSDTNAVSTINSVFVEPFDPASQTNGGTNEYQSILLIAWSPSNSGSCWGTMQINYTSSSTGLSPGTYYNIAKKVGTNGCGASTFSTNSKTGWVGSWAAAGA